MLKNEYLVAKIGVDTAENEPSKVSGGSEFHPAVSHTDPTVAPLKQTSSRVSSQAQKSVQRRKTFAMCKRIACNEAKPARQTKTKTHNLEQSNSEQPPREIQLIKGGERLRAHRYV